MSRLYRDIEDIEHSKELLLSNVCGSGIRNILVAENSATKYHSAVLRAGSQADAYPPGCPQFWGDPEHHDIFHLHTAYKQTAMRFFCVSECDILEI